MLDPAFYFTGVILLQFFFLFGNPPFSPVLYFFTIVLVILLGGRAPAARQARGPSAMARQGKGAEHCGHGHYIVDRGIQIFRFEKKFLRELYLFPFFSFSSFDQIVQRYVCLIVL